MYFFTSSYMKSRKVKQIIKAIKKKEKESSFFPT